MSEERRKVLEMLAEGKISSEEAEKLLDAVGDESSSAVLKGMPRYLYVRVTPKEGAKKADQVKVTIPLALVKAGINFASLLPGDARKDIEDAMGSKGINFNLKNMNGEEVDALMTALQELEVDVETSENTVKIYTG
jgi:hypothetical protein